MEKLPGLRRLTGIRSASPATTAGTERELMRKTKFNVSRPRKEKKLKEYTVCGTFTGHPRGFGFVTPEGAGEKATGAVKDIFIPRAHVNSAMHKDYVEVQILPGGGRRPEGRITKVIKRGTAELVGTYQADLLGDRVIPDNVKYCREVLISRKTRNQPEVRDGDKVVVSLIDYGTRNTPPYGVIVENLGPGDAPGVDILSVARAMDIPMEFPDKVLAAANRAPEEVSEADTAGREDLRGWQIVTIDGPDAKDLDDAVSLTRSESGYTLGVHIADVSHYVVESSAMDKEALHRGTSVYLADRVIPMLPERLSNGICSLNAGTDRLTLSCIMDFDLSGKILDHRITKSVIRVGERMSYPDVRAILEEDAPELKERYRDYVDLFFRMLELSQLLRKRRERRGAIDFDFPEAKIIVDAAGHPTDIVAVAANCATRIIEEFMLAANETVAEDFCRRGLPFVYRIHEDPDAEKVDHVLALIRQSGGHVKMAKAKIQPREVRAALEEIKGRPEERMISRLMLRSMQQARYSPECSGHFGLAARYYCHFTSPIRRYPDLQIHRIITDVLDGRMTPEKERHYRNILEEVAGRSSMTERQAVECERETVKLKMAQFMAERVGESFDGFISGTTDWGIYVELPNTVEGLVRMAEMEGDQFTYNEAEHAVVGAYTGAVYRLGDKVRVKMKAADIHARTIDFELEGPAEGQA